MNNLSIQEILESSNPWWADSKVRVAAASPARRDAFDRVRSLLRSDTGRAAVLIGPRQVGKSTVLLQLVDSLLEDKWPPRSIIYLDFSDPRLLTAQSAATLRRVVSLAGDHPRGARKSTTRPASRVFLLDEVSHSVDWDRELKQAVDQARRRGRDRFVVTDSSASILRGGGRESGVGRWDEIRMEGLSFREYLKLASARGEGEIDWFGSHPQALARYLALGGFPEYARSDTQDFASVREQIRSDVADRAIARDLARYKVDIDAVLRLFQYLVRDSGAIFTAAKRARDMDADRRSVAEWLGLLEDAQVIVRLEAFTKNAAAALRSKPRLYAADHALITALAITASAPEEDSGVRGKVFEAVVFRHLRDVARGAGGKLSYFRSSDDRIEGDFVLSLGRQRILVEVTSASSIGKKHQSIQAAAKMVNAERSYLVYGGPTMPSRGDMTFVSIRDFVLDPDLVLGAST